MCLLLGPTGSGKTLLSKRLQIFFLDSTKDIISEVPPTISTVGTNLVNVNLNKKYDVTVRELGGCMCPIWHNYFKNCKTVISCVLKSPKKRLGKNGTRFVIDLSNRLQVSAACMQFLTVVNNKLLKECQVLVLLNKVDLATTMTRFEFESLFRWNDIVSKSKHKISLLEISAYTGRGLEEVLNWIQQNHKPS